MIKLGILATTILTISSLSSNVTSKRLEATSSEISKAYDEIVAQNYSEYDENDFEDKLKLNIISYYETHQDYASTSTINELKNFLKDNDFSFVRYDSITPSSATPRLDLNFSMLEPGGGSTAPSENEVLKPITNYSTSNASVNYVPNINGQVFLGFYVTKEAAIMFYNAVIDLLNLIIDVYDAINTAFPEEFIGKVIASISSKISLFIAALPNLLKVILAIVVLAFALIAAIICYFGYHQQGFYIGYLRRGLFYWTFECGIIN